jgi:hypothetical protein
MPLQRIRHPEFRREFAETPYPFADGASLSNGADTIPDGTFLDLSYYPIGGREGAYLAAVARTLTTVTLTFGDAGSPARATGSFDVTATPSVFALTDTYGRPAGVVVSETARLAVFGSWAPAVHAFTATQTPLAASCCIPTPEAGLRGVQLEDGSVLNNEVWLVGDDGVALTVNGPYTDPGLDATPCYDIRVDVVGDPLFRRKVCTPTSHFATPIFVRKLHVVGGPQEFDLYPDVYGRVVVTANNAEKADSVLRVRTTHGGIIVEAAGGPG